MDTLPDCPDELQFETLTLHTPTDGNADGAACAGCQRPLDTEYFDVNGHSVCSECRDVMAQHAETPRGIAVLCRAGLLGAAAAVVSGPYRIGPDTQTAGG